MNNLRLLTALLIAVSSGAAAYAQQSQAQVLPLEYIFEVAETSSARLRPAAAAVEVAERELSVARSGRLPEIAAALNLSYIGDGFTTARDFGDYQKAPIPHLGTGLNVTVTQPVYTGGAISGEIRLAELKRRSAGTASELTRETLRLELTGYYLSLYRCLNLKTVVEHNVEHARTVLADMRARLQQGLAIENDITRYELLISDLELQKLRLANSADILNSRLVEASGLPAGTVVQPDSTVLTAEILAHDESWWQEQARQSAPGLQLASRGVDISRQAERLVKAARMPAVGVQAGWNIDGPILTEVPPIDRNLSYWYVGLNVSYKLSSLFKNNKAESRSRAATYRAEAEYEVAADNLAVAVHADWVRYLESLREVETRRLGVELAVSNYNTVATRFNAGMALITDMLDAANSRLEAEQNLVNARINIIQCYYNLLYTSGKI